MRERRLIGLGSGTQRAQAFIQSHRLQTLGPDIDAEDMQRYLPFSPRRPEAIMWQVTRKMLDCQTKRRPLAEPPLQAVKGAKFTFPERPHRSGGRFARISSDHST